MVKKPKGQGRNFFQGAEDGDEAAPKYAKPSAPKFSKLKGAHDEVEDPLYGEDRSAKASQGQDSAANSDMQRGANVITQPRGVGAQGARGGAGGRVTQHDNAPRPGKGGKTKAYFSRQSKVRKAFGAATPQQSNLTMKRMKEGPKTYPKKSQSGWVANRSTFRATPKNTIKRPSQGSSVNV
jgi:hypothetical protein